MFGLGLKLFFNSPGESTSIMWKIRATLQQSVTGGLGTRTTSSTTNSIIKVYIFTFQTVNLSINNILLIKKKKTTNEY